MARTEANTSTDRARLLPDLGLRNLFGRFFPVHQVEIDTRHRKEKGFQGSTAIPELDEARIERQKEISLEVKTICQNLILRLLGPSARMDVWRADEGMAPSTIVDLIGGIPTVRLTMNAAADMHVGIQHDLQLEGFGKRLQAPTYASIEEALVNTAHLIDDTSTDETMNIDNLIQLGVSVLEADKKIAGLSDVGIQKIAILNYVLGILHARSLSPEKETEISAMGMAEIRELAKNQLETQFLHMLFTGTIDEKTSLQVIRLLDTLGVRLSKLVKNPAAYATATFAEASPFANPTVKRVFSELDLAYAEAVRQLTEYAYLKAVSKKLFPRDSPIVKKLTKTLAFLASVGKFKSDDQVTIRKIRDAFAEVEQHIHDVMVKQVGTNVILHAKAAAPHDIVQVLSRFEHLTLGQMEGEIEQIANIMAENFASGTNRGDILPLPQQTRKAV